MMAEEKKIHPGVIIAGGLGLGLVGALGIYALAQAAPGFKVSDLVIYPTVVNPGQVVTISCTVTNTGSEAGSYTLTLGGDFMADQIVTLAPGQSKVVAFEVTPAAAKTYVVSVDGLSGSFVATELPVADIRVEDLVISPTEPIVGEVVTIIVTATNYGNASGSKTITCTVS
jgi:ethanolamine utilization microcompartment shell protein EutS